MCVYRVHEDIAGMRYGLRSDRLHRLHYQARVHSYQQYHPRCLKKEESITCFVNIEVQREERRSKSNED